MSGGKMTKNEAIAIIEANILRLELLLALLKMKTTADPNGENKGLSVSDEAERIANERN